MSDSYYPKHAEYKKPPNKDPIREAYEQVREASRELAPKFEEDWNCVNITCEKYGTRHAHLRYVPTKLSALF